jgi:hypothetical protein
VRLHPHNGYRRDLCYAASTVGSTLYEHEDRIAQCLAMGMFSKWLDRNVECHFGKDAAGRLAFFPHGWRRPGYYIEASDEYQIKALVAMYTVAAALLSTLGSTGSIVFMVMADDTKTSRRTLESGLIAYAISFALLYVLPALLLWKTYRGLLDGVCSSLPVGPESIRGLRRPPSNRRIAVVLVVAAIVLALSVAVIVRYR